jgi:hypothetical protein
MTIVKMPDIEQDFNIPYGWSKYDWYAQYYEEILPAYNGQESFIEDEEYEDYSDNFPPKSADEYYAKLPIYIPTDVPTPEELNKFKH